MTDILDEARRRRTFAIISHPDAGKTTLTEKFLLYSGAIQQAGAVQSRKADRNTTSDWLEIEQKRGISVTSAVARFTHDDTVLNLLDTPGHRDFSEDTYRVLSGVDAAVMVIDAARGVEPQTEKLYAVCRVRKTPVITFVNKMDRPAPEPLAILDDIEAKLGLVAQPVTWPIKPDATFHGVVDRRNQMSYRFLANTPGGARIAQEDVGHQETLPEAIREELALLYETGANFNTEAFMNATATPIFFGSALNNFGVRLLLDAIVSLAPAPLARPDVNGDPRPLDAPFSGIVFKVQANLDARHRDRLAFVRVCSGEFSRGSTLVNARTGRRVTAKYAHAVFGRERETVDEAYPGDVIGLVNATDLRAGDTLHAEGTSVRFAPPPIFTPEYFRTAYPLDRSRSKQFRRGMQQLDEEGAVQVLRHPDFGDQAPVWAAVGELQFEVAAWRMEHEFGAPVRLESCQYTLARATVDADVDTLKQMRDVDVYRRESGAPFALFRTRYVADRVVREHPELTLDTLILE